MIVNAAVDEYSIMAIPKQMSIMDSIPIENRNIGLLPIIFCSQTIPITINTNCVKLIINEV